MGHDLVNQVDSQGFFGIERFVGQQDTHGVGVGDLARQVRGPRPRADPPLTEQRELKPGMFLAGDADVH